MDPDLALAPAGLTPVPVARGRAAELQRLLEAERRYFERAERRAVAPDEALRLADEAEADPQRRLWLFVPTEGGEAVAFLDLHLDHPEPGTAHIGLLLVRGPARGRGHGRAIVAALEDALRRRGGASLRLSVVDENPDAHGFWERLGFPVAGRLGRGVTAYEKPLGSG